jgi:hypothetical protein
MKFFEPFRTHSFPSRTAGLREAPGADRLPLRERGDPAPFLLLRAEHEDVVRAETVVRRDRDAHRAVDARELLDDSDVVDVGEAGTAVRLRDEDTEHPEVSETRDDVAGEGLCLVPLHDVGRDLGFRELADHLPDGELVVRELEAERDGRGGTDGRRAFEKRRHRETPGAKRPCGEILSAGPGRPR